VKKRKAKKKGKTKIWTRRNQEKEMRERRKKKAEGKKNADKNRKNTDR
jgi:hypothetical protein